MKPCSIVERSSYLGTMASLFILIFGCFSLLAQSEEHELSTTARPRDIATTANCALYKHVGANDLSVTDLVVKSETGDLACIKARFSLAIKVETDSEDVPSVSTSEHRPAPGRDSNNNRLILGYLPLDSVVNVENTCPKQKHHSSLNLQGEHNGRLIVEEPREMEMSVAFECGQLTFKFKRDKNFYLSSIRGFVNLDSSTVREFEVEKPMFATSDLSHHFKSTDLLEVNSTANTRAFILTANFYNLEFETFRNTTSRAFIRPPDDFLKPIQVSTG